jgi:glycosyltransferase involved in cell wall biosynthesis
MNIAHILSNPIVGGAETLVVNLAKAQILAGHSCVVLNFWRGSDVGRLAADASVPYIEMGGASSRFISPLAMLRCRSELQRLRSDVICAHGFRVQMMLRVLLHTRRGRPKLVGILHGVETWRKGCHVWLDRLTARWMDGFVGISEEVCAVWKKREGITDGSMVCIPNGIDTSHFKRDSERWPSRRELGLPLTGKIVLTIANYRAEKGYAFLIEVISRVLREGTDLEFCWCGKGEDEKMLRTLIAEKNISDRVHFLGHIQDVRHLLAHAELFVLPSREEGIPLSLLEAMSMEMACVATDVGGVSEVLRSGIDGTLVRYPDVDDCVQAILRYQHAPGIRRSHGASARQRVVQQFDMVRCAQQYENYFLKLLKDRT